jgi:hypothetical protein
MTNMTKCDVRAPAVFSWGVSQNRRNIMWKNRTLAPALPFVAGSTHHSRGKCVSPDQFSLLIYCNVLMLVQQRQEPGFDFIWSHKKITPIIISYYHRMKATAAVITPNERKTYLAMIH